MLTDLLRAWGELAAIALALAFAVPVSAYAKTPPRLLVWINGDKGYNGLQKVGDAFSAVSGVGVVVQHPEGAPDKFQAAAGAGKGPDIFCWAHDRAGEWAKSGLIVTFKQSARIRDEIEDSAWEDFSYKGKILCYPLAIEAIGLIYNTALVKIPPKSFEELIVLDKSLALQGKRAVLWDYNKAFFTWPMLAGPGGFIFARSAQGELDPKTLGVNASGAVKGAEMLQRLIRDGHMPQGARYAEMEGGFSRGQIAMMISGPWSWDNIRKSNISFGVAPIPSVAGYPSKPFVGVLGCMVAAPSKVKDLAREFLENHLLRVEGLRTVSADVSLGTPANKAYFRELSADPNIRATMTNALAGEPIPNIPETGRFFPAMDAALEAITNGRQSPKDALDGAAARMRVK